MSVKIWPDPEHLFRRARDKYSYAWMEQMLKVPYKELILEAPGPEELARAAVFGASNHNAPMTIVQWGRDCTILAIEQSELEHTLKMLLLMER